MRPIACRPPTSRTKACAYRLGELLRDSSDHILLLTATPHKGDPVNFSLFLQLLDADAYADVKSIREAMERRRAPFYLRRTKEAMVYFPERRPDGTWAAEPIFTKRIPHTVDFQIDGAEFDLYRDVTRFVKRESARAAADGRGPARPRGRLPDVSLPAPAGVEHATPCAVRSKIAPAGLKKALKRRAGPCPAGPAGSAGSGRAGGDGGERARSAGSDAGSGDACAAAPIRCARRFKNLRRLAAQAQRSRRRERKRNSRSSRTFFSKKASSIDPDQRLLLFTEFKDTLDYLVGPAEVLGFSRRLHPRRHEVGLAR